MRNVNKMSEVRMFRYDRVSDEKPRYESFSVPYEDSATIMDILNFIYEKMDRTIAYRSGCEGAGHQRCGACPVVVNGKPVLSCKALAVKDMIIDPHPGFKVVRDLVVDFDKPQTSINSEEVTVKIKVDSDKCDGCRDCVILCPMNVLELEKKDDKVVSSPENIANCCGESCSQCEIFCKNSALKIEDINFENR